MIPEPLTAPLSASSPTGDDLLLSAEFDAIAEARRCDDPSLAQGEWARDLKVADWPAVLRQCETLLSTRTKDLRVAGWYTEAKVHLDGFAGLAQGYALAATLCDTFWQGIHPTTDNEERAGCLRWLVTQSIGWIRRVPLGDGADALETLTATQGVKAETVSERRVTWRATLSAQRGELLANSAQAALHALRGLETSMHAHLGDDAPSITEARTSLEDVIALVRAPRIAPPDHSQRPATETASRDVIAPRPMSMPSNPHFASREDALQALRNVALFFRDTEPHSPVAYLADKAARWGDMPLHAWLHAVLGEGDALVRLRDLLDIPKEPQ